MTWRPYRFEDVTCYSSSEARAATELATLVPHEDVALRIRRAVGRAVAGLQGPQVTGGAATTGQAVVAQFAAATHSAEEWLSLRYVGPAAGDPWHGGDPIVRIRIGLGSRELQAVLELPLATVRSLIGRIVEVPSSRLGASDLITPVEEGILSFFAERITAELAERVSDLEPLLPLSVLTCTCEHDELPWGRDGIQSWFSLAGSVPIGAMNVPFRVLLPWKALRNIRTRHQASPDFFLRRNRRVQRMLHPLAGLPVTLTGRLGVATLEVDELTRLEATDILLFDAGGLGERPSPDCTDPNTPMLLCGTIELSHCGWDRSLGAIRGSLEDDGTHLRFRVEEQIPPARYSTQEAMLNSATTPPSPDDPESTAPGADSTSPGTHLAGQKLAEASPVQLRVEIGRVRMTLRELSELGAGQILNLNRATTDPVSLVVDDRVVGRGELVQVEGELGVRISSLGTS